MTDLFRVRLRLWMLYRRTFRKLESGLPAHGDAGLAVIAWHRSLFEGIYKSCIKAVKDGVPLDGALDIVMKDPRVSSKAEEIPAGGTRISANMSVSLIWKRSSRCFKPRRHVLKKDIPAKDEPLSSKRGVRWKRNPPNARPSERQITGASKPRLRPRCRAEKCLQSC